MENCRYIVFCPYFGKLPNIFPYWLISCKFNSHIKFIIFTDDRTKYNLPKNVTIYNLSFFQFKEIIQKKFDFNIALDNPYKLCDFKVTYGFVFEEYIKNYIYWGYCDLDMFFGDLRKYIPESGYEKISHLGHLTLYKNMHEINCCFMETKDFSINYKDILGSKIHFGFDEIGNYGINNLFIQKGYKIYELEKHIADIYPYHRNLSTTVLINGKFLVNKKKKVFTFENGKIYGWSERNKSVQKEEYVYIHMQKRKIECDSYFDQCFLICPHCIKNYKAVNIRLIEQTQERGIYWIAFKIKLKAAFNIINRSIAIKKILREKKK